jgi:ribosomal protein L9
MVILLLLMKIAKAARNYFVPFQLAYYVPMMNGTPILPDGWKVKKIQTVEIPAIYPADPTISEMDLLNATFAKEKHVDVNTILEKLESAQEPLLFERPLINTGKTEIYGSVSNVDICQEIQNTLKIPIKPNQLFMRQGRSLDPTIRIKSIGDYSVIVKLIKDKKMISVEMNVIVKEK